MKRLLGWAIVAIGIGMGVYFGFLSLGMPLISAALAAAGTSAIITVMAFGSFYSIVALLAVVGIVIVGQFFDVLAVVLSACLIAVAAFNIASKLKIEFQWAFFAYLVEGAGMYATLKLGLWWPAALAALLLGLWWSVFWLTEKFRPAVSI